ncbi:MAG: hypothetical protein MUE49_00430 [Rhodospirillales bacterium]|nr:hypothetical protein [Rhodospirillales bacterium]
MHGIAAYNTGGLRANFAGSDLIIDTDDPKTKRLVQVKTGCSPVNGYVYLTQCKGEEDLGADGKFVADFIVFVNIDKTVGGLHQNDGQLDFQHLTFYIMPRETANAMYRAAVQRQFAKPKRDGGVRKLANMAVGVPREAAARFLDAWHLLREPVNPTPRSEGPA